MVTLEEKQRQSVRAGVPRGTAWGLVLLGFVFILACRQEARLADSELREPVVTDVTLSGLKLDDKATPEMVTFALLKAIQGDMEAGRDVKARELAFEQQFQLAAPTAIHQQHIRSIGKEHAQLKESVYRTVHSWAPTLGHYVGSFGFTYEEALKKMRVQTFPPGHRRNLARKEEKHVLLEAEDPDGDPNASVVVRVRLVKEERRWRVWWVGFERSVRRLPTTLPSDEEGVLSETES